MREESPLTKQKGKKMEKERMFLNDIKHEIEKIEYSMEEVTLKLEIYQDEPVWDPDSQEFEISLRNDLTENEYAEAKSLCAQYDELMRQERTLRKLKRRFQKMFGL